MTVRYNNNNKKKITDHLEIEPETFGRLGWSDAPLPIHYNAQHHWMAHQKILLMPEPSVMGRGHHTKLTVTVTVNKTMVIVINGAQLNEIN